MTTDEKVRAIDARSAAASWHPQQFSKGGPGAILDPIVEPLWSGLRVLALVDDGRVTIRDVDGDEVDDFGDVAAQLADVCAAKRAVLDGYLTHQPIQGIEEVADREASETAKSAPTINQLLLGSFGRLRSRPKPTSVEEIGRDRLPVDEDVALVVVDLLWLDDEPLLSVPLLERKRMLDSVVGESQLVRRGVFVRPPIDSWVGSWRSFGFSRLAYKGANSRYTPGAPNPQWAIRDMPARR